MQLVPVELMEKLYGTRYGLVVLAAKRVMELREGAAPLIETDARNPLTIALLEIAAGKIYPKLPEEKREEQAQEEETATSEQQSGE